MTDDYDFRASERRRARELDELEARRLRARERQRAQLRAAHRRRRLTVLGVLGLVIGVASGAWVWRSDTPKVRRPVVPAQAIRPKKTVVRADARVHARRARVGGVVGQARAILDEVLATPGLNLIQLDVKDENGEVAGLGDSAPALAKRFGAAHAYYDLAHVTRLAHDRNIWVVARIVSFKDPIMADRQPVDRDPATSRAAASGATAAACPWLNQYSPGAWKYLIDLAKAAARTGVDEVQFDYVRFPSEGDLSDMRFPHKVAEPHERDDPALPRGGAQGAQAVRRQDRRRHLRPRGRPRSRHRPGRRAHRPSTST